MMNKPELQIEYGPNQIPVSAACSACRTQMPQMKSKGASATETLHRFTIQFELHKQNFHQGK